MSDKSDKEDKPKKKKGKGLLVKGLIGLVLVGVGGGGTFALVQAGMIGEHGEGEREKEKDLNEEETYRNSRRLETLYVSGSHSLAADVHEAAQACRVEDV